MRGSAAASGQAARARAAGGLLATQAVVRPSRGKVRAGRRTQSPCAAGGATSDPSRSHARMAC